MACAVNFLRQHASSSRSISGVLGAIPLEQRPKAPLFFYTMMRNACTSSSVAIFSILTSEILSLLSILDCHIIMVSHRPQVCFRVTPSFIGYFQYSYIWALPTSPIDHASEVHQRYIVAKVKEENCSCVVVPESHRVIKGIISN